LHLSTADPLERPGTFCCTLDKKSELSTTGGRNKLSLLCRWVPREGWRNELTNQQKEQDVSINGQSQRKLNWNLSQLPADQSGVKN
jgi:hypothetical protein